ncbi:MAG TPA: hypothetical protein VFG30_29630 [Polyangiales bacterium]|nr:hypothetical protein [Polyangiales bacterium]
MRVRTLLGCVALSLSLLSCAQDGDDADEVEAQPRGVVRLQLTAADSGGVQYRLRNAQFQISGWPDNVGGPWPVWEDDGGVSAGAGGNPGFPPGYVNIVVSSETDPDAEFITTRLIPGSYNINLMNDDWYLERETEDGIERVAQVVLLTPRYQYVYVWDGGVAYVNYTFGVDGEPIDFRSGELQIGISIEKPGEHCPGGGFGGRGGSGGNCGAAGFAGGFGAAGAAMFP